MPDQAPPREIEIEKSVLASILLYQEDREKAFNLLDVDDFYATDHQIIFQKCRELAQNGKPVAIDTVWAELDDNERKKIGSVNKLSRLTNEFPVAPDVNHYVNILKDRKARRRTLELINSIAKRSYRANGDPNKIIKDAQRIIAEINSAIGEGAGQFARGIKNSNDFITMELPEKRVILDPWMPEQSITLISGYRGVGKSWLVVSILDAISKKKKFGPWETETPVPSLYLDGEMAAQDLQYRAKQLDLGKNCKSTVFIYSDAYSSNLGQPRANLLDENWRNYMKQYLIDNGIKLLALDNIASLAPGINENSKEDYDPINEWLLTLRFSGIATILLHHVGKAGTQRGTSAREDNIDTSIILKRPIDYNTEDGCRFIMEFNKNRVVSGDQFLLADLEFKYERGVWTWEPVKVKATNKILRLLDEGYSQKEVVDLLEISKSHVSQTRKKAIQDGLLTKDNKLTPAGNQEING
jgi:hypothetical protein